MFYFDVYDKKLKLVATNWKDIRIYLKLYYTTNAVEEIGYISLEEGIDDDLDFRKVPTEVESFIEENRDEIIDEAEY